MKKTIFLLFSVVFFPFLNSNFEKKENFAVYAQRSNNFDVSSGKNHSLLKTDGGEVYAWGTWGDVSLDSNIETFSKIYPSEITNLIPLQPNDKIKSVSSGDQHSFILTQFGDVFSFGFDGQGQLGDGGEVYLVGDLNYASQLKSTPTNITANFHLEANDYIVQVEGGSDFSVALSYNGHVYTFGENNWGQLGIETSEERYQTSPIDITHRFELAADDKIVEVAAGSSHAMARTLQGNLYVWGNNNFGQLGDDKKEAILNKPTKLDFASEKVIQIACGSFHSYVLTNMNYFYGFGYNGYGQIADRSVTLHSGNEKITPYEMSKNFNLEVGEKIVDIYSGFFYGMAVTSNHNIYAFGQNTSGQLGIKNNISTATPQKMNQNISFSSDDAIQTMALGEKHSLLVSSRGEIYSWGDNGSGQLGEDYSISSVLTPNDITENFPPIIKLSMEGSTNYCKYYSVGVQVYYINSTSVDNFSYAWSHSNKEVPITTWNEYQKNEAIVLNEGDGTYYLWIKVVNYRENEFFKVSKAFYLDSVAPTLQINTTDQKHVSNNEIVDQSVYVKAADNNEDVTIAYRCNYEGNFNILNEKEHIFNLDGTYEVKAIDVAKNESQLFTFRIDTINPYIININQKLIQDNKFITRNKTISIQTSEVIIGYFLNDDNFITTLNHESNTFTLKLKKGVNKIKLVDASGKVSDVYKITYKPRFLEDTELLLWIFGTAASFIVLMVVIVYVIRSRKRIKDGMN